MKGALPENAKIAKEAKECMQECVSEFISFITSEGTANTLEKSSILVEAIDWLTACRSIGEMSTREAEDCQRRRYPLCHDFARFRELR
jgi:histone H3/H4